MSSAFATEYLSIGGNRHTAASAWSTHSGLLAFGADQNVALWNPLEKNRSGIQQLLHGHNDKVTSLTWVNTKSAQELLVSGSADGLFAVWALDEEGTAWRFARSCKAHDGAVNVVAGLQGTDYVVTGAANSELKLWSLAEDKITPIWAITPKPRFIPLTVVLGRFAGTNPESGMVMVAAGTRNDIFVYALKDLSSSPVVENQATLRGHEGWIHSLSLTARSETELYLASASHDKYVRLWKFDAGNHQLAQSKVRDLESVSVEQTLTAKAQTVSIGNNKFSITFEALLLGHEDWVYSVAWNPAAGSEQLLTASADGSLAIWEPDPSSGIWISASKLGEISGQKGATTATGSAGGFWTGLWSPDGQSVTCLGRTGSWRLWQYHEASAFWRQTTGISGHVSSTNGLCWSPGGEYLLSTSSDQTTRLHAEWRRNGKRTWHEFARPQIHGYDLNCVSSINGNQFASGADEKLLRVFNEPKDIAQMLHKLCELEKPADGILPDKAAMPVLGLSNKAMGDDEDTPTELNGNKHQEYATPALDASLGESEEPPTEDMLARHTLWPEHEKLYGHGYEISESACSNDKRLLATACKASSTEHAVIRLYNTETWHEIKPPLSAHSLTITSLRWSCQPDNLLLSVGRDRQWAVFGNSEQTGERTLLQCNAKAHTRMILDAAWSPIPESLFFATAGRDKTVKLWQARNQEQEQQQSESRLEFIECSTIKRESPTTALSVTRGLQQASAILVVGEESGKLSIHLFDVAATLKLNHSIELPQDLCASRSITRLAWRHPNTDLGEERTSERHLAIAAADGSVRITKIDLEKLFA